MKKLLFLFALILFSCSNNSTKYSGDFEYPISDYWIIHWDLNDKNEQIGNNEALKFNFFTNPPEIHFVNINEYNTEKNSYDIEWLSDANFSKNRDSIYAEYTYVTEYFSTRNNKMMKRYSTSEYNGLLEFIDENTMILRDSERDFYLKRFPLYTVTEARELVKEKQSDYELGLISKSELNTFKDRIKRYF